MLIFKRYLLILLMLPFLGSNSRAQSATALTLSSYVLNKEIQKIEVLWPGEEIEDIKIKSTKHISVKTTAADQFEVKSKKNDQKFHQIELEAKAASGKTLNQAFTLVKDEFEKNKVIAHRGAWKNVPTTENSLAALKHAVDLKCQGSEFDVYLSADTVLYIHHDPDIGDLLIEKTPSPTLEHLRLENGESLPTLSAYLLGGKNQNRTRLIVEIKPTKGDFSRKKLIVDEVLKLVAKTQTQAWVEYISFVYDMCKMLKQKDPFATVAYLNGDKAPADIKKDNISGIDYSFKVMLKNPQWIEEAHNLGMTVNVWTVNDEAIMDWMLKQGVDYITTNEPELLLKKVGRD